HVRAHFQKPVVGVAPAVNPAAKLTQSGVIGLLATPATVARPYTLWLIADFASHCTVHRLGSARLVQIAEDKLRGQTPNTAEIRDIISHLFTDPALDTLVLACTHSPLLRAELEAAAHRPVQWVDSGEAIARRVLDLLPVSNDPAHRLPDPAGFESWLTADGADRAEFEAGLARLVATGLPVLDDCKPGSVRRGANFDSRPRHGHRHRGKPRQPSAAVQVVQHRAVTPTVVPVECL